MALSEWDLLNNELMASTVEIIDNEKPLSQANVNWWTEQFVLLDDAIYQGYYNISSVSWQKAHPYH